MISASYQVYLVDRKEVKVSSANLTRGGIKGNIEAGILSNNPVMLREICNFVYALYLEAKV
jgi:hypothetical protein